MLAAVGLKALIYFEAVSTLALAIGLLVGEIVQPGAGFNIDPASLDPKQVSSDVTRAKEESIVQHLLAIIPNSFFDALAKGDLLQVLLIAILSGFAVSRMGELGQKITYAIEVAGKMFIRHHRARAPIGAFGAMAFTIGAYGLGSLWNLVKLIATFYATSLLFVLIVLGLIARLTGFSILRFPRRRMFSPWRML